MANVVRAPWGSSPVSYFDGTSCFVEKGAFCDLDRNIHKWEGVQSLCFRACVVDKPLDEVCSSLSRLEWLCKLAFVDMKLSVRNLADVMKYLKEKKSIKSLSLINCVLSKDALYVVFEALKNTGIKFLDVSKNDIQEMFLQQQLEHLRPLTELRLFDNEPFSTTLAQDLYEIGVQSLGVSTLVNTKRGWGQDFRKKKKLIIQSDTVSALAVQTLRSFGVSVVFTDQKLPSERCVYRCVATNFESHMMADKLEIIKEFLVPGSLSDKKYLFERVVLTHFTYDSAQPFNTPVAILQCFIEKWVKIDFTGEAELVLESERVQRLLARAVALFASKGHHFKVEYFHVDMNLNVQDDKLQPITIGESSERVMRLYQKDHQFFFLEPRV